VYRDARHIGAMSLQIDQQSGAIALARSVDVLLLLLEQVPADGALARVGEVVEQDEQAAVMHADLADRPPDIVGMLDASDVPDQCDCCFGEPSLHVAMALAAVAM
jgi:hypothetical protein